MDSGIRGPHMQHPDETPEELASWLVQASDNIQTARDSKHSAVSGYLGGWEIDLMRRAASRLRRLGRDVESAS